MKVYKSAQAPFQPAQPGSGVKLLHTDRLSMAIWKFDKGVDGARHAHPEEQIACVLQGRVEFITDTGRAVVGEGEQIVFAGNEPHGSKMLEDSIILDVFSSHREDLRAKFPSLTPEG